MYISIGKFVSFVLLMAQVVEAHIDNVIFSKLAVVLYFYTSNELKFLEQISDHIYVSICASVTCAICGTSGTH